MGTLFFSSEIEASIRRSLSSHSLTWAVDADVASVARGVPGDTKVTRDVGGVWNIAADLNVSSAIARGIISRGGSLQLLAGVKPGNQQALMQYVARDEP